MILILYSCKSQYDKETEILSEDLKVFFKNNISDSTAKIDSFKIIKIDTLTHLNILLEQSNILSNSLDNLITLYKLNTLTLSNSVSELKLYGMLGSRSLIEIKKDEIKETEEKGKAIKFEIDTVQTISRNLLLQIQEADSIKPIGYEAKCFYQLRMNDKSVKRDTTYIQLNQNKDIVKRTDFIKSPYIIDFSKF